MMRTNREVCEEMIGLVLASTPYRLHVGYPPKEYEAKYRSGLPEGKSGEAIQRLEVYWRLPCCSPICKGYWENEGGAGALQMDPSVRRQRCVVRLERHYLGITWFTCGDLLALRSLAVFEEVLVRVVCLRLDLHIPILETVGRAVEGALGVPFHGKDPEGDFVRFYPGGGEAGSDAGDVMERSWDFVVFPSSFSAKAEAVDKGRDALDRWREGMVRMDRREVDEIQEEAFRVNEIENMGMTDIYFHD